MSVPITIRAGTPGDVAALLPMVREITTLHERADPDRFRVLPDILDRYAAWLPQRANDPRSVLLVAERADVGLVGFLVGTIEPEVPIFWIPECGWVHDLWIEPVARRQGVASRLIEHAAERFRALGVKQMRLHTGSFNESARKAFTKSGFRPCVVEMLRAI